MQGREQLLSGRGALQELRALLRPKDTGVDDQDHRRYAPYRPAIRPLSQLVERKSDEHREAGACEVNLAAWDGR